MRIIILFFLLITFIVIEGKNFKKSIGNFLKNIKPNEIKEKTTEILEDELIK